MNEREIKGETPSIRAEVKVQQPVKEERMAWIEDEVEDLERWDGME